MIVLKLDLESQEKNTRMQVALTSSFAGDNIERNLSPKMSSRLIAIPVSSFAALVQHGKSAFTESRSACYGEVAAK